MKRTKSTRYYTSLDNLPAQIQSIMERMRLYFATNVFREDSINDALNRFVVADIINGGSDSGIRFATEKFGTNQNWPFCAYSYDFLEEVRDRKNYRAEAGLYFDYNTGKFIRMKPVRFIMPFFFFFNNVEDYYTAQQILHSLNNDIVKLYIPIILNGVETVFNIDTKILLDKGSYAGAFEEYLRLNNIWDIACNCEIEFQNISLDDNNVHPVDDMIFALKRLDEEDISLSVTIDSINSQDTPELSSSVPTTGSTGVAVDSDITITFNVSMSEKYTEEAITLDPYFSAAYSWDSDSKILTISPYENLTASTEYTITIDKSAYAWWNNEPLEDDITITFTTV